MGWYGVDLDGTLAHYDGWKGEDHIGEPIPAMVERVKTWLAEGKEVRIFTARVFPITMIVIPSGKRPLPDDDGGLPAFERRQALIAANAISQWSLEHIGAALPITCIKDYSMIELWDDRAVQVIPNTGERADGYIG